MTFQLCILRGQSNRLPAPSFTLWKSWRLNLQPSRQRLALRSSVADKSNCGSRLTLSQSRPRSFRLPRPVRSVQRLGSFPLCCVWIQLLRFCTRSERAPAPGHRSPRVPRASRLARHIPLCRCSRSSDASACVQGSVLSLVLF